LVTVGSFAIILDPSQRVLLCHRRDRDLWNLPGGGLERDESPWDAVVREIAEETGLIVAVERLISIYSQPEEDDLAFAFCCEITGGTPTLTDEADAVTYFALDALPAHTYYRHVERVRDALQADGYVLREQRGQTIRLRDASKRCGSPIRRRLGRERIVRSGVPD